MQPSEFCWRSVTANCASEFIRNIPRSTSPSLADDVFSDAARSRIQAEQSAHARNLPEGLRAASAIAAYLEANSADSLNLLRDLEPYAVSNYLVLDDTTRINLELIANYSGDRKGSLLTVLDRTVTPIGARRLKQWLLYPLLDETAIRARHDGVQELVENFSLRQELKHSPGKDPRSRTARGAHRGRDGYPEGSGRDQTNLARGARAARRN